MNGDILTDAAFTNLTITGGFFVNNKQVFLPNGNATFGDITVDKITCNQIATNQPEAVTLNVNRSFEAFTEQEYEDDRNECIGEYSKCLGGYGNYTEGESSVVLGGTDNQSNGVNSVPLGRNALALHDNTIVFNTSSETTTSTMDSQVLLGAENGLFFKLPNKTTIRNDLIPEGFACWCWDSSINQVCMKTKQNDIVYKTNFDASKHEIKVNIDADGRVIIDNPDLR